MGWLGRRQPRCSGASGSDGTRDGSWSSFACVQKNNDSIHTCTCTSIQSIYMQEVL